MDQAIEPVMRPRNVITGAVVIMALVAGIVVFLSNRDNGGSTAHKAKTRMPLTMTIPDNIRPSTVCGITSP